MEADDGREWERGPIDTIQDYFQYLYPVVILLSFIIVGGSHSIIKARKQEETRRPTVLGPGGKPLPVSRRRTTGEDEHGETERFSPNMRKAFQWLQAAATITFFGVALDIALRALVTRTAEGKHTWFCKESKTVYVLGGFFLYVWFNITLFDWKKSPNFVHFMVWSMALVADVVIFACDLIILTNPHQVMIDLLKRIFKVEYDPNEWDQVDLALSAIRILLLCALISLYALSSRSIPQPRDKVERQSDEVASETTPLINGNGNHTRYHANGSANHRTNGTAEANITGAANGNNHQNVEEETGFYRPDKLPHTTWYEYLQGYAVFFPYMWPSKKRKLQILVIMCFLLLLLQRVVNIAVPYQMGAVTDCFADTKDRKISMPWLQLALLMLFKLLQGPSGLLGSLRAFLWIPVSQYAYRQLTQSAFEHVHSLSLDFHLGKRTGEVLSALNKGSSVNSFLEQVTFQVFPMLIDLFLAISFAYIKFDSVYAAIICIITFYYLYLTIRMAQTTADERRAMSNADREEEAVKNDSIVSYETVKYFNAEDFEFNRYRQAISNFQTAEARVTYGISYMNIVQSLVFMSGMMVAMMLGAYQVAIGSRTVGDFVLLMTYLNQLQGPLNYFGTFYRTVQQAMISGERLLELFKQQPTVVDRPGVEAIDGCEGKVEFNNVTFAYDRRKPALSNLNFVCNPGTTTALVGESGGGKSTLFRLMYRYFSCESGGIEIDGHDVKDVTIDSVRRHIGVVPQDTILFNETLMYNLRYAKPDATDEEIYEACRAASIHDRILEFPDQYNTKVGERGLRLSGGEKQRVAIARTLLKNPKIIMLDEATSALDSHTEHEIQSRLSKIGQGRTLLIIAHRLSTITHADQILVLNKGRIVERGCHQQLLDTKGIYASMWRKQAKAERKAELAREAKDRADRALQRAGLVQPSQSEGADGQEGITTVDHSEDSASNSSDESSSTHTRRTALPTLEAQQANSPNPLIT